MNELIVNVNKLPTELIDLIKEYIPTKSLVFVNKKYYILHHPLIKQYISFSTLKFVNLIGSWNSQLGNECSKL